MKIKFNKFERVAGLFVLTAIGGGLAATVGVAVKRGWLEPKIMLEATFSSADGLHIGTSVQMAGLRAGSVENVELKSNNEIRVQFMVSEKFHNRIRQDSLVRVMRPFVIGEKVLDISVGTESSPTVAEGAVIQSEDTPDIMDMLNGRKVGGYLAALSKMSDNLKEVANSFTDPKRMQAFVKMFDELHPLTHNMNSMAKETTSLLTAINKKQQVTTALDNLVALTNELNRHLPTISEQAPSVARDLAKIAHNVAVLTEETQKLLPAMQELAPEFPRASRRAIEALDETVVTLKALQKSFILRGNVQDVRDEELQQAKKSEKNERRPASENEKSDATKAESKRP